MGPTASAERVRLWPHRHGSDGMFVAAFTRTRLRAAGTMGRRGEARRVDPVSRPRASRRSGQARARACRQSSISTSWTGISYLPSHWARWWSPRCDRTPIARCTATSWSTPPEPFFDELAEAGLDVVSFHHEAVGDPIDGHRQGAGSRASGPVSRSRWRPRSQAVFPYLDRVDDVMLMSIEPGWSGQTLDPAVYPTDRGRAPRDRSPRARQSTSRSTAASRSTTRGGRSRQERPC